MTVKNKWNGQTYEVWESSEKTVKLKKENGEIIEISKSEFNFNVLGKDVNVEITLVNSEEVP